MKNKKDIRGMSQVKRLITCAAIVIPLFIMVLFSMVLVTISVEKDSTPQYESGIVLSTETQSYAEMICEYAERYGIREYARYLLAIMQVETGGYGVDVMQSLAYSGLPEDKKTPELSIDYACRYFAALLQKAKIKGVDMDTVIQAYNFGEGYIDYVADNGKVHSFSWASSFAAKKCGGEKVAYNNPIAVKTNGGWRYAYGNMFYVYLVKQYLAVDPLSDETASAIIEEALKYKGWKYVWGGSSPSTSFDCSGLTSWCYSVAGLSLPRTAQEQYETMQHITLEEAEPGDLVFFTGTTNSGNYITHVGIYVGNNKMFHAGDPIGYADLTSTYWKKHFVCVGRMST